MGAGVRRCDEKSGCYPLELIRQAPQLLPVEGSGVRWGAVVVELSAQQPRGTECVGRRLHCDLNRARLPVAQVRLLWVGRSKLTKNSK